MKRIWAICLWVPVLAAQTIPGRYIVELAGDPAATYAAARRATPSATTRSVPFQQALDEGRAIVLAQQARIRPEIEKLGARVVASVGNVANALIVLIPDADAARLSSVPGVAAVYPVLQVKANLDAALPLHKVPDAWTAIGGKDKAGAGMKIAIIDSGIDNTHAGFNPDGFAMPDGFPKTTRSTDQKFTSNKIIVVRNYVDSEDGQDHFGHGTAVAMEAAGVTNTSPLGPITGVAPAAWLGSYKAMDTGGHGASDALLQALNDAVGDGMDVINMSLTTPVAPRVDQDFLVRAVERASAAGIVVVVSAGNEGFGGPNGIGSPATAPSALAVGATYNSRVFVDAAVAVDGLAKYPAVPGNGPPPSDAVTAKIVDVSNIEKSGQSCAALPAGSLAGGIALIMRGNCTFEEKLTNAQAAGAVGGLVYNNSTPDEFVRMNVGAATLPAMFVTNTQGLDIKKQVADGPSHLYTLRFTPGPFPIGTLGWAEFSSRGPNVDLAIKPDLSATGAFMYTATQTNNDQADMFDATGYTYSFDGSCLDVSDPPCLDGTSFSAPLVAGAAAAVKGGRPGLTSAQYRSLLVNSVAPVLSRSGKQFSAQTSGTGLLDLAAAIKSTVVVSPVSLSFGAGTGTVDLSKELNLTNLGTSPDTLTISVSPFGDGPAPTVDTTTLQMAPRASQKVTVRFNASSLKFGEYQGWLHIQSSQTKLDTVVAYWYAVPDHQPKYITTINTPFCGAPGSAQTINFRVTDQTGIPVPDALPSVVAVSGGGRFVRLDSRDELSPGLFVAAVRLGNLTRTNTFEIDLGDLTPVSVDIEASNNCQ